MKITHMLFISHLYTATRLGKHFKISKLGTYYTATILPDIRYTALLDRKTTHVPSEKLDTYLERKTDAYRGYFLHLWIDENMGDWGYYEKIRAQFPFLIRNFLAKPLLNVVIELYCLEQIKKSPHIHLENTFQKEFHKLHIKEEDFAVYIDKMQQIISAPTISNVESILLSDPKLKTNKKLKKYLMFGKLLLNVAPIRNYLTSKVESVQEEFVEEIKKKM